MFSTILGTELEKELTNEEEVVETETDDCEDEEEPSEEEWQMAMEEDSRNEPQTVSYYKWLNELKGNGWEQVPKTYDSVNKTVQVRRV